MASNYVSAEILSKEASSEKSDSEFTQLKRLPSDSHVKQIMSDNHPSSAQAFALLGLIFASALVLLFIVYMSFPRLDQEEKQYIKLPRDINDAKHLGKVLSRYTDTYYAQVLGACIVTYIFLQTFAIPGSIFLSILSGYLFSRPIALFIVCLCSAIGASFCYLLSYLVGRRLVWKYIPQRAEDWAHQPILCIVLIYAQSIATAYSKTTVDPVKLATKTMVKKHEQHLLNYMIFLRITPFLPNWFINITAPVIGVPMMPFFLGTLLGVAPPSFVAIQAGTTLQRLTSSGDAVSWFSVAVLAVLAILSLLPTFFKRQLEQKLD